jgi:hypothetical protein
MENDTTSVQLEEPPAQVADIIDQLLEGLKDKVCMFCPAFFFVGWGGRAGRRANREYATTSVRLEEPPAQVADIIDQIAGGVEGQSMRCFCFTAGVFSLSCCVLKGGEGRLIIASVQKSVACSVLR